jgi:hypothetical protein
MNQRIPEGLDRDLHVGDERRRTRTPRGVLIAWLRPTSRVEKVPLTPPPPYEKIAAPAGPVERSNCLISRSAFLIRSRRSLVVNFSDIPRRYAAASRPAANTVSCRSNAQAIRTSLLASATTTVFPCARLSRPRSQLPSGVAVLDSPGRAARAPWTMSLRRYLLPRLVIPSSFGLPPVVA